MQAGRPLPGAGRKHRIRWLRPADGQDFASPGLLRAESSLENPVPQTTRGAPEANAGDLRQRHARFVKLRIEFTRLGEGVSGRSSHAERFLAAAQFKPEKEVASIEFDRPLQQFQSKGELLVVEPDSTC